MPKDQFTPRDELICGKLDDSVLLARGLNDVALIFLLERIRYDAERMEAGLVRRKAELTALKAKNEELTAMNMNTILKIERLEAEIAELKKRALPELPDGWGGY